MKHLICALSLLLAVVTPTQDKTVQDLWKKYDKAIKADKPKDAMAVLELLKKEASAKHLAWDYYDAGVKYVNAGSSINWKDRKSLEESRKMDLRSWGEPVAIFYDMTDQADRINFMHSRRKDLSAARNPKFYQNDWRISRRVYGPALVSLLPNDYEYALWSLYLQDTSFQETKDHYAGTYPMGALLEYEKMQDTGLEAFASRYKGKAVSLLARQRLLQARFDRMEADPSTTSDAFKALKADCEKFIAERGEFSGSEKTIALCCTIPESIVRRLDEKSIDASVLDSRLTLSLRNIESVSVKVLSGKKTVLLEKTLKNEVRSYHRPDTIKFDIPVSDDGDYTVRVASGKIENNVDWHRYTLSMAVRTDSKGLGVYVADFKTGEPLSSCDLSLLGSDGSVLDTAAGLSLLSGFTPLPASISSRIAAGGRNLSLRASALTSKGSKRQTDRLYVSGNFQQKVTEEENPATLHCTILPDRTAFNPGETVHFKVVAYEGTYEYRTVPGLSLDAKLLDPQGNVLATQPLKTGDFGSAAGEFLISGAERNGIFRIVVSKGKAAVAYAHIRVDEFVLPTFSLNWETPSAFFLPGDNIRLNGTIKSYSGHSLSSAKLSYKVARWGDSVKEGTLTPGEDGKFQIEFTASDYDYAYYSVSVKVVDATGETLEFSTSVSSSKDIPVSVDLSEKASGSFNMKSAPSNGRNVILGSNKARLHFRIGQENLTHEGLSVSYKLLDDRQIIASGTLSGSSDVLLDLAGRPSGLYTLEAEATARTPDSKIHKTKTYLNIIKVADTDTSLGIPVEEFFKELPDTDGIGVQVGVTDGPAWIVSELFANGNVRLDGKLVKMAGKLSESGSLTKIVYPRPAGCTAPLTLKLLYFHNGKCHEYSRTVAETTNDSAIPLSFTRFLDTTTPGTQYSFSIKTSPSAEVAATVFDKSTEAINPNVWNTLKPLARPVEKACTLVSCGRDGGYYPIMFKSAMAAGKTMTSSLNSAVMLESVAILEEESMADSAAPAPEALSVRENFSPALAWEPFLRSDKDGNVEFKFFTSDKLSTYVVQLFSHDQSMRNAVLRSELMVTIPVKVAIVQPRYLYETDRYVARVTLSNGTGSPVSGKVSVRFCDGPDYRTAPLLRSRSSRMTIPASGSATYSCELDVPATTVLGLLVSFTSDGSSNASDAVFVTIPVSKPEQTLTEAHSAIFPSGADAVALEKQIRSSFVNVDGSEASLRTISIRQMLAEAFPSLVETDADDILSQLDALYSAVLADRLGQPCSTAEQKAQFVKKILACRGAAGGFGWFEGMDSSPLITATLLEKAAKIGSVDALTGESLASAVQYLDKSYFSQTRPAWCGGITLAQYLHVRALYPEVPFDSKSADKTTLSKFKADVKDYLTPSDARGLNGRVFDKARRLSTIHSLLSGADGEALAKAWGLGSSAVRKLSKSQTADIESLLQYAVSHPSGGCYYPNAVLPYRGLLESELYAHSLLADLFSSLSSTTAGGVSEGIRIWMMVQKETQRWGSDPAYMDALTTVFHATKATLDLKVMAASATFTKPFKEIKAAGNGFSISRTYYAQRDGRRVKLSEGDALVPGEKIRAEYTVSNDENRSFVCLVAPRPACFTPVNQFSGFYGWWMRPLRVSNYYTCTPQGYRNVLVDRTEYYFDCFPEGETSIVEELFVTQDGRFSGAVAEIESLYAPHYRANDVGK